MGVFDFFYCFYFIFFDKEWHKVTHTKKCATSINKSITNGERGNGIVMHHNAFY